jgi:fructoselysine 6-phosphate deglycase
MKTEYEDQILAAIAAVKDRFAQGRVKNVYFVACGGSKATMMPAQYMLDREIETPAAIYTSNEFNYGTPKAFGKDSIVFTISHSGTTPETVRAAQTATDAGAVSICFTNEANSPLWNAAQYPIQYEHGKDVADENKGGQIQLRCWFELLKVLDSAHEAKWQAAIDAMSQLTELKEKAMAQFKNVCTTYASATKRAPLIYTMGSGINYGEVYSTACCWLMEMQWVHSSPIHSGEFFHGPFEITDYDVPFIIVVSTAPPVISMSVPSPLPRNSLTSFSLLMRRSSILVPSLLTSKSTTPTKSSDPLSASSLKHTPTTPATTLASVAICGRWSTRLITPH